MPFDRLVPSRQDTQLASFKVRLFGWEKELASGTCTQRDTELFPVICSCYMNKGHIIELSSKNGANYTRGMVGLSKLHMVRKFINRY